MGYDQPIRPTKKQRRGPDFFKNFNFILDTAQERQVDLVIHGGDLFDRSRVHPTIVNKTYDRLFEFVDTGIPLVLVPGNHDRSTLPSSLFLQHPNLHIFYEPQVHSFQFKGQIFHIGGFPFIRNIGDEIRPLLRDLEQQLPETGNSILCMHQAVHGATVGPANYTFRAGPQVIRKSDLVTRFDMYLSGHIHRHQIIKIPVPNKKEKCFIYPGSIERTSFAERDEEKGFVNIEFEDDSKAPRILFEPLESRPMHVLKIEDPKTSKERLNQMVKETIQIIDAHSILLINSPTELVSNWLNKIKPNIPPTIHLQIRHMWLNNSRYNK